MSARIVQVANFYSPTSGGLKTAVDAAGRGYRAAGHDVVLVVPGPSDREEDGRITLRSPRLPGGAYHLIVNWSRLTRLIRRLEPDRLEVSDKLTLAPLGRWARAEGIPALLWSHERIDAILAPRLPGWAPLPGVADAANTQYLSWFDTIVCSSAFAATEFERLGATNVQRVPLGVDLETFIPDPSGAPTPLSSGAWGPLPHARPSSSGPVRLICVGRLSKEKGAELAVSALRQLRRAGRDAHLTLVGDGPYRPVLEKLAGRLPVHFAGHVADRAAVARMLAAADVALAPCRVESFGLAVLEALACGTPVVTVKHGAARELLAPGCGLAAAPYGHTMAAAVERVLSWPTDLTARAARLRAEQFPWSATVAGLLAAHRLEPSLEGARWAS
jgi:alpha-1,6-mannosyltransferase